MSELVDSFARQGIDYALMGSVALGIWSAPRATVDMDFLILLEKTVGTRPCVRPANEELGCVIAKW